MCILLECLYRTLIIERFIRVVSVYKLLTYPLIRHYLDEVMRGEWLKHWHKEVDHMFISRIFATEYNIHRSTIKISVVNLLSKKYS